MKFDKSQFIIIFGKKVLIVLGLFFAIFSFSTAQGAEESLKLYFFWGFGCPHCAKEKEFLSDFSLRYPQVEIERYEIYFNSDNQELLEKVAKALEVKNLGVPLTIVGGKPFIGYVEGTTAGQIEEQVKKCLVESCPDPVASIVSPKLEPIKLPTEDVRKEPSKPEIKIGSSTKEFFGEDPSRATTTSTSTVSSTTLNNLKVPFLGPLDLNKTSLPVLAVVIGLLDGFNPCAMWTLLFLISLLLGTGNRFRMWFLGSVFIVASAVVYFVFMAAWLNLIIFLGFIFWIRILIGLVALASGGYSLRDFYKNKNATCEISETKNQAGVFEKLKKSVREQNLWLALGGIVVLAFSVNLVELVCSAGLPAIFSQVLALNHLSAWQYYLYILVYIFFFMLDDLIVFFISMMTLHLTGVTTKYTRASRLVGGLLMLAIGVLLIFRPDLLMMG